MKKKLIIYLTFNLWYALIIARKLLMKLYKFMSSCTQLQHLFVWMILSPIKNIKHYCEKTWKTQKGGLNCVIINFKIFSKMSFDNDYSDDDDYKDGFVH